MARPIAPTPILTGNDAKQVIAEVEQDIIMTPAKEKKAQELMDLAKKLNARRTSLSTNKI